MGLTRRGLAQERWRLVGEPVWGSSSGEAEQCSSVLAQQSFRHWHQPALCHQEESGAHLPPGARDECSDKPSWGPGPP